MNAENLRILAHELRADPESYDQTDWFQKTRCGTVCCIAGKATLLAGKRLSYKTPGSQPWEVAEKWLGLSETEGMCLFESQPHLNRKHWPPEFSKRYGAALYGESVESPAFVAADLLDALADGKVTL